jgi:signal transduction histidine kinase
MSAEQHPNAALLQQAFDSFTATSLHLGTYYRHLEEQVGQLRHELERTNRALKTSLEEQETLREQAERNRRLAAVGEMAARMAHELRNPLGSIELFASLLAKSTAGEPDARRWAAHLSTAVRAMDHVLSNLLLFTGKPRPRLRPVSLPAVIDDACRLAGPMMAQHRIECRQCLDAMVAPVLTPVLTDEDLLRQILLNLILNAVDAMPQGGVLTIAAAPSSSEFGRTPADFTLSVGDTGAGIPEAVLPKIFDPFFTTKHHGTGLGLAIVHNAVTALGGAIEVESREGAGALFRLTFASHPHPRPEDGHAQTA